MNWPAIMFCIGIALISSSIGHWKARTDMQDAAISAGCAKYDPQTGDFTWGSSRDLGGTRESPVVEP